VLAAVLYLVALVVVVLLEQVVLVLSLGQADVVAQINTEFRGAVLAVLQQSEPPGQYRKVVLVLEAALVVRLLQ
jgi:hypothetical protein